MVAKKLKELVSISKGKKMQEVDKSNLRYIQIEDLRGDTKLKFCEDSKPQVKCTKNDILIAWDGANAGTIGYGIEGAIGSTIAKLVIRDPNIFPPYLGKFLQSKFKYLRENCTGATIPHISKSVLTGLNIPLPPFGTQKRIADILDNAAELRDKTKQLLEEYDELAQSIFLEMFGDPVTNPKGWEKSKTIDFCSCIVPGRDKPKSFTGNIPWVTTNDLNHLAQTSKSRENVGLTINEISKVKAKIIPAESVILTCVGDLGVVTINKKEMVVNQQLHAFQCSEKLNNTFLMYNISYQKPYMYRMASTTTVPYMNKTVANGIPTLVPPIQLQNQFAEKIALIEQQKELAKQELKESEDLFQALLQKAFKGELVKEEELEIS